MTWQNFGQSNRYPGIVGVRTSQHARAAVAAGAARRNTSAKGKPGSVYWEGSWRRPQAKVENMLRQAAETT